MEGSLTPAYGRDYRSKGAVLEDWLARKDFVLNTMSGSTYFNIQSAEDDGIMEIQVRFAKMRKVGILRKVPLTWVIE